MNTKSRIDSILKANCLDFNATGLPSFNLSELQLQPDLDFALPTNIRLGHLAEKIVSELIKLSANYNVLYENIQLIEEKKTIGEIDFMIEEITTKKVIHLELAYKFYLFDPSISSEPTHNWIGPNRNDSLREKLDKLKRKQLPLLYDKCAESTFSDLIIGDVSQAICLFVSLFIPYEYKGEFSPIYKKAIQGYYLNLETFTDLDHSSNEYHLPSKKEWGMEPCKNEIWTDFAGVEKDLHTIVHKQQSPLCWQKQNDSYAAFFIVWW
jgi:uncharacterized protein